MGIRKKIGILLILIGFGIPVVLYFFQDDGVLWTIKTHKQIQRNLSNDEIKALNEISTIKKQLETLMPSYMKEITTNIKETDWMWEQLPNEKTGKSVVENISFEDFVQKALTYERKLIDAIKRSYAINKFEHEAWHIDARKQIEIPFRQFVGFGVFLVLTGLGFLIFSRFSNKEVSR